MPNKIAKLVSVNTSYPRTRILENGKKLKTAFFKEPVQGKIYFDSIGLEGDQVADPIHHGGPDKALCIYSVDHFSYWSQKVGRPVMAGGFGENLSVEGGHETEVHIGDIYRVGEAEIQISQPRQPCHKINKVFDRQDMACGFKTSGFTGYYARVLKAGWGRAGNVFHLVARAENSITVDQANHLLDKDRFDPEIAIQALSLAPLSDEWKKMVKKRVDSYTIKHSRKSS